jgi:hypothetical protein
VLGRAVRRNEGGQIIRHRLRQRQHQHAGIAPLPDGLELLYLGADVLRVLGRRPRAEHVELLAVARPGRPRLVHRALKRQHIPRIVVEDARLRVIERTVAAGLVGSPGMIQRHGNAHLQQSSPDHPGQGPQAIAGNQIRLGPPARREPQPLTLGIGRLEVPQQGVLQGVHKGRLAPLVGFDVVGRPGCTRDQPHRRALDRRQGPYLTDEGGQSRGELDQRNGIEIAGLTVIAHRLAQDRHIEVRDQPARLAGIVAPKLGQRAKAHGPLRASRTVPPGPSPAGPDGLSRPRRRPHAGAEKHAPRGSGSPHRHQ